MNHKVHIYSLDRAYQLWLWLCPRHLRARQAAGWTVKERKDPPHELLCDDCRRAI